MTKLQKIISKIEKRHNKKIDLSLDRTFNLLNKLGNPQNKLNNVVTVVGTNSKASMATALGSILKEAGFKCNLYTASKRRWIDIKKKVPLNVVQNSLKKRTLMDKRRKNSPLIMVKDAILIRTDKLSKKQVLLKMSKHIEDLN